MKNHLKISKNHVFFSRRSCFSVKKKRQGCTSQKTGLGIHQTNMCNKVHREIRRPLPERRACETLSNHSSSSSQASQASQARPGRPASQASWASKPQASRHRCQQFFFIGAPARFLRPPQAATGRHRPDSPLSLHLVPY